MTFTDEMRDLARIAVGNTRLRNGGILSNEDAADAALSAIEPHVAALVEAARGAESDDMGYGRCHRCYGRARPFGPNDHAPNCRYAALAPWRKP